MADDAFSVPSYFASGQDAICKDDSCKWPSGSSNNVVQRRVRVRVLTQRNGIQHWWSEALPKNSTHN